MIRRYSISDIADMRHALRWLDAPEKPNADWEHIVEDRLRTHIVAGTLPWELQEAARNQLPPERISEWYDSLATQAARATPPAHRSTPAP